MRFMLMIYDNPDTRDLFTQPGGPGPDGGGRRRDGSADRVGRARRGRGARRPVEHADGPRPGGRPGGDRRAAGGGEGALRRLPAWSSARRSSAPWRSPPRGRARGSARWRSGRSWTPAGWRCDRASRTAARARPAGARRARAAVRLVRHLRGRRPGGAARRRRGSGPSRACPSTRRPGSWPWRRAGSSTRSRSDVARRRREEGAAAVALADERSQAPGAERPREHDDTLTLLLLCCHPALSPASQIALTLRAVGGLTTAEIAQRVPRPRGDDGPAHQPRQGGDPAAARLRAAAGGELRRADARRRSTSCT